MTYSGGGDTKNGTHTHEVCHECRKAAAREAVLVGVITRIRDKAHEYGALPAEIERLADHELRLALDTSPAAAALLAQAEFWSRVHGLISPISGELDEEVFACLVGMVAQWKDARVALGESQTRF